MPIANTAAQRSGVQDAEDTAVALLDAVIANHASAEDRPQQHEMTRLVAAATVTGEPLIVQAGTGTGKSLATCAALWVLGARSSYRRRPSNCRISWWQVTCH